MSFNLRPVTARAPLLALLVSSALQTFGCSRQAIATHDEPASSAVSASAKAASSTAPPTAPTSPGAAMDPQANEQPASRLPAPLKSEPNASGHYGAAFAGAPSQTLAKVLADPERFKEQPITVSGIVKRVCERKGCWMELAASPEATAARCRIRFKDYGFFVPRDSQGAQAKVEGVLMVNRVAAARVKHLEGEGAVFDSKNPDGSANETQLIASAVELKL